MPVICGAREPAVGLLTWRRVMPTLLATASRLKGMPVLPSSQPRTSVQPCMLQVSVLGVPEVVQVYEWSVAPPVAANDVQLPAPQGAEPRQATKLLSHLGSATPRGSCERCAWLFTLQKQGVVFGASHEHPPAKA